MSNQSNKPIVHEDKDKIIKVYPNPSTKRPMIIIEKKKKDGE